ncbi:hypothetical protein QEH45_gp25 [Microbacterium phage Shocker]|uniref:Uncharacterized protein n=1 Tax=Microbacterium phage Shocker TaxID=2805839 RepID=A0A890UQR7_9CAUD|nr:hypothetical protein QEH45_gp25 [Microbacterium phage Shocker]QRI45079.1 hypothetical protein SEA_SHOCKER_25 [Microbacterium phage Shocker]
MARFWKSLLKLDRAPDPKAIETLEESKRDLEAARNRSPVVDDMTGYLSKRREQNHFGDALDITFRRRHA